MTVAEVIAELKKLSSETTKRIVDEIQSDVRVTINEERGIRLFNITATKSRK